MISLRLTEEQLRILDATAEKLKMDRSALILNQIDEWYENHPEELESKSVASKLVPKTATPSRTKKVKANSTDTPNISDGVKHSRH